MAGTRAHLFLIPASGRGGFLGDSLRLLGAGTALLCGVLLALATRWRKSLEISKEQR